MSGVEYVVGVGWMAAVGWAHGRSARRLCWLLLPRLSRPGGWIATSVLSLGSLVTLAHLLGSVGWLAWWPVLIGSAVVAVAVEVVWRSARGVVPHADPAAAGRSSSRLEVATAVGCVAALGWQWTTHVADAFDRGMVQADNLWYHGPFMARFLQTGGFGDLGMLGYRESRFYPMDAELLQGLWTMPFDRDVAVPVVNHLFAALGLGAAYVIGRRWGVGALAVLATTVVLALPLVASTQPGQMYNDVMAAALVLAAVALMLEGGLDASCLGVAGASLGLSVGTKLSVLGVVGPLALGVLVVTLLAGRYRSAVAWIATIALTGGFWFVRNWVVHGSPVPWLDVDLGPVDLPAIVTPGGETLLESLDDFAAVREYYADSLRVSFGPLWIAPIAIGLAACLVLLVRSRDWRFLAAASAAFGMLTFPMMPLTGGVAFVNNLRYGVPALMLAMALSALAVAGWAGARSGLAFVCVACVATNLASAQRGRVEAWPGYHEWGFLAAAAIVAGAWWWGVQRRRRRPITMPPGLVRTAFVTALALVMVGGWFLQDHYLEHRYLDSGLDEDPIHRPFGAVTDSHVDVLGEPGSYAMFGPDLSNDVTLWTEHLFMTVPEPADPCRFWRTALAPEPGYIAIGTAWLLREITPEQRTMWFGRDPAVVPIVDDGTASVYYHDRALSPSQC